MKKIQLLLILLLCLNLLVSFNGFAEATSTSKITIANWVKYVFDKQEKELPDGYDTIIHNGHTYVPARFIAEELGAKVVWDDKKKTVNIESAKVVNNDNNIPSGETVDYKSLPTSRTIDDVNVEVYSVLEQRDVTKVFVKIKNNSKQPFQLLQFETSLIVDKNVYNQKNVDENVLYRYDKTWFNDIREDESIEGYVTLPVLDTDSNMGELHIIGLVNDGTQKKIDYKFNIKW